MNTMNTNEGERTSEIYEGIRKKKIKKSVQSKSIGVCLLSANHECDSRPIEAPPSFSSIAEHHRGRTAVSNDACQRIPPACYTL